MGIEGSCFYVTDVNYEMKIIIQNIFFQTVFVGCHEMAGSKTGLSEKLGCDDVPREVFHQPQGYSDGCCFVLLHWTSGDIDAPWRKHAVW